MGNSSKRESIPVAYLKPPAGVTYDAKALRKQILSRQLAPFFPPHEDKISNDAEECPICFSFYVGGLNRSKCCKKGICSACYLGIRTKQPAPSCPFCQQAAYMIIFTGPLSKEEKDKETEEERKVEELLAKMKHEEIEKEKQRQELLRRQSLPVPSAQPYDADGHAAAFALATSAPGLDMPPSPHRVSGSSAAVAPRSTKKKKTASHGSEIQTADFRSRAHQRHKQSPRDKSSNGRRRSSSTSSTNSVDSNPPEAKPSASLKSTTNAAGPSRRVSLPPLQAHPVQPQQPTNQQSVNGAQAPVNPFNEVYEVPPNMNLTPDELEELMLAEAIRRSMMDSPSQSTSTGKAKSIESIPEKEDEDESVHTTHTSSNALWAEPNVSTKDEGDLSSEVSTFANQTATNTATAAGCLTEDAVSDNDEDVLEMRAPVPAPKTFSPLNPFASLVSMPSSGSGQNSPTAASPRQSASKQPENMMSSQSSPALLSSPIADGTKSAGGSGGKVVNPFSVDENDDDMNDPALQLALRISMVDENDLPDRIFAEPSTPAIRATPSKHSAGGYKQSVEFVDTSDSEEEEILVRKKKAK